MLLVYIVLFNFSSCFLTGGIFWWFKLQSKIFLKAKLCGSWDCSRDEMESPSYIAGMLFTFHPQWASVIYLKLNGVGRRDVLSRRGWWSHTCCDIHRDAIMIKLCGYVSMIVCCLLIHMAFNYASWVCAGKTRF